MGKIERWTHADEAELQRALERKERVTSANMAPLLSLVRSLCMENDWPLVESITKKIADNADRWRDALEPFDSGIRAIPEA